MARGPHDRGQQEQSYDVWSGSGLVYMTTGVVLIFVSGPVVSVTFVAIGAVMLVMAERSPFHGRG